MTKRRTLHLDVESRSVVDLPKANAYVYFDHPSTDLWLAAWAFGDDEPKLWFPGDPCPPEIVEHVRAGGLVACWNAAFERLAWRKLLTPKYGWPEPSLEQFRCVMAQGYAATLPGKLEQAALALGIEEQKDNTGYRIMLQMSKPRRPRKDEDPDGIYWWEDPEKLKKLGMYCLQDVRTEVAAFNRLPPLCASEQALWFLDQRMNDLGVSIDVPLCHQAKDVVKVATDRLNKEMVQVTDWSVRGVGNVSELIAYIKERGLDANSVAKDQIIELLVRDDLTPDVRRALEIRQEGSKTSTAKINAMLARVQVDKRMRGNLQFHGANTGRWAARGAQLQNLPRPIIRGDLAPVIGDLKKGSAELLEVLYGPALTVVSDCIRGMIVAPKGQKLISADFSQIEARMTAWMAGQSDKVEAFARYDRREGADIYTVEAGAIYVVSPKSISKDDPRRQVGKVSVLSLGFGGGPAAFAKMAKNYNVDIGEAHDSVMSSASAANIEAAEKAWTERGKRTGMSQRKWLTAELIKLAWRQANPRIPEFWKAVEDGAIEAVQNPGSVVDVGAVRYRKAGSWLFCRLPSGRCIAYAYPDVALKETPWGAKLPAMRFWGVDSFTKKWSRQEFYGGLGFQNIVQAAARDVMSEAMTRAEQAGFPPILTVHDEIVSETEHDFGNVEQFCGLMSQVPTWAAGCPIAAEGWEGPRYRK